ncbi:MAG TPA: methyltransferase domain-containing protein [Terriglobia bacterium]|nr:methyltransferase domain-containing protein [Terriglobia bacterium]
MKMLLTPSFVARKILGRGLRERFRRRFPRRVPDYASYASISLGRHGLEIGGPSAIFGAQGSLPVYARLDSLDNCIFSGQTIWEGSVEEGKTFLYDPEKPPGRQFICEATDLRGIPDASYDCVLASHVLEHLANPLKALREWKRVLGRNGLVSLVLPHKDGTFDWRRPTTTLAHLIEDFDKNVGEDDRTHLSEILDLHDLTKDEAAGSAERFRERCLHNDTNRAMHHHVFDTAAAVAMVDHIGLQLLRVDLLKPFHVILLSQSCTGFPDNRAFLGVNAPYRRRSPFPSDRAAALP